MFQSLLSNIEEPNHKHQETTEEINQFENYHNASTSETKHSSNKLKSKIEKNSDSLNSNEEMVTHHLHDTQQDRNDEYKIDPNAIQNLPESVI